MDENKSGGIGHNWNMPDPAEVKARIEETHVGLVHDAERMANAFGELPDVIEDDKQLGEYASLKQSLLDLEKIADRAHGDEKRPYLRCGQVVDQHFKKFVGEKLQPLSNAVQLRINIYMQKKTAAERARREEERRKAEEIERQARAKLESEQRAKAEAEAAAARARSQERAENHLTRAAEHAAAIPQASHEARLAAQAADDARMETMAKPADLARTRMDNGRLVTVRQVPHVRVIDRDKLNKAALWDFIDDKHIEAAAKKWAARGAYRIQMDGLTIEMREESEVR